MQEQLGPIREHLYPSKTVSIDEVRDAARTLSDLVPNALVRELGGLLQGCRAAPNSRDRTYHETRLAMILVELVGFKGCDFLANAAFSAAQAQLSKLAGGKYLDAVKRVEREARARRAQELQKEKQEERWRIWSDQLRDHVIALSTIRLSVERPLAPLSDNDKRLCLSWANRRIAPMASVPNAWEDFIASDKVNALRMWSARSAERAAISFLSEMGKVTVDVSIRQLEATSQDWKTHDIEADGEAIDVKNSRTSFSSPDSYVEHTVPEFKTTLSRTADVTIMGVLSDYVSWERIESNSFGAATVLGYVRRCDLEALGSWMQRQFGDILDFDLITRSRFKTYPGWLFDYPGELYRDRAKTLESISALIARCPDQNRATRVIPGYIYALLPPSISDLAGHRGVVSDQFVSLCREVGLSRRSLFAWIVGLMLRTLTKGDLAEVNEVPMSLRRLLFGSYAGADPKCPGGLYDPKAYISNLIEMFELIGTCVEAQHLQSMRYFKMTSPTILRGRLGNETWQTIFAHCGGWRRHPFPARCGKSPIHLGNTSVCPECGRLICPDCAYCMDTCSLREGRMWDHTSAQDPLQHGHE
jgi:hypothetical protein